MTNQNHRTVLLISIILLSILSYSFSAKKSVRIIIKNETLSDFAMPMFSSGRLVIDEALKGDTLVISVKTGYNELTESWIHNKPPRIFIYHELVVLNTNILPQEKFVMHIKNSLKKSMNSEYESFQYLVVKVQGQSNCVLLKRTAKKRYSILGYY